MKSDDTADVTATPVTTLRLAVIVDRQDRNYLHIRTAIELSDAAFDEIAAILRASGWSPKPATRAHRDEIDLGEFFPTPLDGAGPPVRRNVRDGRASDAFVLFRARDADTYLDPAYRVPVRANLPRTQATPGSGARRATTRRRTAGGGATARRRRTTKRHART